MNLNKIYIVTNAPMPIGYAATNRILSYVVGFEKNKIDCEVIVFRKTEERKQIKNYKVKGKIGNSKYSYLFKSTVKSVFFIRRRIDNIIGLIRLFKLIFTGIKKNDVIIYYSSYSRYAILLRIVKLFKNFIFLKEESESPMIYKKSKNKLSWFIFRTCHYKLFDGFLLMTNTLLNNFDTIYPKKKKILVPMTVDIDRFTHHVKLNDTNQKVITYIGSLNNKKDGILILLKAFNIVIKDFSMCNLQICGYSASMNEYMEIIDFININNLKTKIDFKINVNNTEIPQILNQSDILVLPRPDSLQAKNGFPTKLGEYLASGKPTVVTDVGEILVYLKDNESTFVAKPGDIESLANKLKELIQNEEKAMNIGMKGRDVALRYFNNIVQTKVIISFIKESF